MITTLPYTLKINLQALEQFAKGSGTSIANRFVWEFWMPPASYSRRFYHYLPRNGTKSPQWMAAYVHMITQSPFTMWSCPLCSSCHGSLHWVLWQAVWWTFALAARQSSKMAGVWQTCPNIMEKPTYSIDAFQHWKHIPRTLIMSNNTLHHCLVDKVPLQSPMAVDHLTDLYI